MKIIFYSLLILFCLSINSCKPDVIRTDDNTTLTIGTFNMEWLGDGINDLLPRTESQMQQTAEILNNSAVEIIAVQEIENPTALARVVSKMNGYSFICSKQNSKQRLGLIYKDYISISNIQEYEQLNLNERLRNGYVLDVSKDNYTIKIMVVHLKSSSRYDSTEIMQNEARELRTRQAEIISNWADSMIEKKGVQELAIIGDFNDFPNRKKNNTLQHLTENSHLYFLTKDIKSCKYPLVYTIDNIVVSSKTNNRVVKNSVFVDDFHFQHTEKEAKQISDHCLISVAINIKY